MANVNHRDAELSRRAFLVSGAALGLAVGVGAGDPAVAAESSGVAAGQPTAGDPSSLEIFNVGYPRSFYFRESEGTVDTTPYDEWARTFSSLNGIMGKVVEEERPNTTGERNVGYFTRFKREHPSQMVVMHYNGRCRRPQFDPYDLFTFGGHWTYRAGTVLAEAAPAQGGQTTLHVEDVSMFELDVGAHGNVNDEIGIAVMGSDGRPDWHQSEQTSLVAKDPQAMTITVERGLFGTEPGEFPAGSYIAPHVVTGPWSNAEGADLLWWINLSPYGPRDAFGRNGQDAFVEDLARRLEPGGLLGELDGVQFDVFEFTIGKYRFTVDIDGDRVPDQGVVDGVNVYGLGQIQASHRLRERLPNKLIMTDGLRIRRGVQTVGQRPDLSVINGVEKEVFRAPTLDNNHWSTTLEGLEYCQQRARQPALSFINPRAGDEYATWRLAFVAAQLAGVGFTPYHGVNRQPSVLDEVWAGVEHRPNWLGQPTTPAVHLAEGTRDLLRGGGVSWRHQFVDRFTGPDTTFTRVIRHGPAMAVHFGEGATDETFPQDHTKFYTFIPGKSFTLANLELPGEDAVVALTVSADPLETYTPGIGRLLKIAVTPAGSLQGGDVQICYVDPESRHATFYFKGVGPGNVDLHFLAEGDQPLLFRRLRLHPGADATYREFEHGLVLANPASHPYTFDLADLFPGASFRRLQGTPEQDPDTNDGTTTGRTVTLGPIDGLALHRTG